VGMNKAKALWKIEQLPFFLSFSSCHLRADKQNEMYTHSTRTFDSHSLQISLSLHLHELWRKASKKNEQNNFPRIFSTLKVMEKVNKENFLKKKA
jgi:hypothetical protein